MSDVITSCLVMPTETLIQFLNQTPIMRKCERDLNSSLQTVRYIFEVAGMHKVVLGCFERKLW